MANTTGRTTAPKAKAFLTKMVEIMTDVSTSILSDVDMFYLVNNELDPSERISMSYFKKLKGTDQENEKSISQIQNLTDQEKKEFINAFNTSRVRQKMNLAKNAFENPSKAYPFLWALERKNTDLQLNKSGLQEVKGTTINITVGNQEHKGMIEDIINNTIDIPYDEVKEPVRKLRE